MPANYIKLSVSRILHHPIEFWSTRLRVNPTRRGGGIRFTRRCRKNFWKGLKFTQLSDLKYRNGTRVFTRARTRVFGGARTVAGDFSTYCFELFRVYLSSIIFRCQAPGSVCSSLRCPGPVKPFIYMTEMGVGWVI